MAVSQQSRLVNMLVHTPAEETVYAAPPVAVGVAQTQSLWTAGLIAVIIFLAVLAVE